MFRQAVEGAPEVAVYRYNLATALIAAGNMVDAERELDACLALDPRYWRAHLTLTQLKRQTSEANHIPRLEGLLADIGPEPGPSVQAHVCLHMALAKEYEDLGDYPEALAHLIKGKAAAGREREYAIGQDEQLFSALRARFPSNRPPVKGFPSEEPIFVIGMPRTGTTLVERIISSHPDVHSAGEMLNFGMAVKYLSGSQSAGLIDVDTVERSQKIDFETLGKT